MKYFLDTEFYEDGVTIDLISIAVVAEDGREFYACSTDAHLHRVSPWVRENVLPQLPPYGDPAWMPRAHIAENLSLLTGEATNRMLHDGTRMTLFPSVPFDKSPQFWAYYADYDWVVLCQLFGTMMRLPPHFPRHCMDLKQWAVQLGVNKDNVLSGWPKQEMGMHNALFDARWNAELYDFLEKRAAK
jgi:hypothetical protein